MFEGPAGSDLRGLIFLVCTCADGEVGGEVGFPDLSDLLDGLKWPHLGQTYSTYTDESRRTSEKIDLIRTSIFPLLLLYQPIMRKAFLADQRIPILTAIRTELIVA